MWTISVHVIDKLQCLNTQLPPEVGASGLVYQRIVAVKSVSLNTTNTSVSTNNSSFSVYCYYLLISIVNMAPMFMENDVEVGESLPPATEHVSQT